VRKGCLIWTDRETQSKLRDIDFYGVIELKLEHYYFIFYKLETPNLHPKTGTFPIS
jgi:hypothetical protein